MKRSSMKRGSSGTAEEVSRRARGAATFD